MSSIVKWKRCVEAVAQEFGGTVEQGSKHLAIILPNGRKTFTSATPSDHRVLMNARTKIRRVAALPKP